MVTQRRLNFKQRLLNTEINDVKEILNETQKKEISEINIYILIEHKKIFEEQYEDFKKQFNKLTADLEENEENTAILENYEQTYREGKNMMLTLDDTITDIQRQIASKVELENLERAERECEREREREREKEHQHKLKMIDLQFKKRIVLMEQQSNERIKKLRLEMGLEPADSVIAAEDVTKNEIHTMESDVHLSIPEIMSDLIPRKTSEDKNEEVIVKEEAQAFTTSLLNETLKENEISKALNQVSSLVEEGVKVSKKQEENKEVVERNHLQRQLTGRNEDSVDNAFEKHKLPAFEISNSFSSVPKKPHTSSKREKVNTGLKRLRYKNFARKQMRKFIKQSNRYSKHNTKTSDNGKTATNSNISKSFAFRRNRASIRFNRFAEAWYMYEDSKRINKLLMTGIDEILKRRTNRSRRENIHYRRRKTRKKTF